MRLRSFPKVLLLILAGCGGGSATRASDTSTGAASAQGSLSGTTASSASSSASSASSTSGSSTAGSSSSGTVGTAASASSGSGSASTATSGSGGAATSSTSGSSGSSTGTPDAGPIDPCVNQPQTCPTSPVGGYAEGDGLREVNRCAFPMQDQDTWATNQAIVDQLALDLPSATVTDVAADLNRTASAITASQLPGNVGAMKRGFAWSSGDENVAYWIPQGITGSGDASATGTIGGKRLILVSWYYDQTQDPGSTADKGVRLALVDVTSTSNIGYRFLLLVEPTVTSGHASFKTVQVHAGGIAWYGDLLYVADTSHGFRVFDLGQILQVDTSQDLIGYDPASGAYFAHGYKYVVPQLTRYQRQGSCGEVFSFVSLDRTTTPPSLVTGEYSSTDIYGRLFRYPLNPATQRIAGSTIFPTGAWFMGQKQVQGALSQNGPYLLSSSAPAGGGGILYKASPNASSSSYGWVDAPEDLFAEPASNRLWCVSEAAGSRYVFATALSDYLP